LHDKYRLATEADTDAFFELIEKAYEPIRALGLSFPAASADRDMVRKHIQEHAAYVLEQDGVLTATITVRFPWSWQSTDLQIRVPYLCWFAVSPAAKNKGVGSKLLAWIEEEIISNTLKAPAVALATMDRHPWLIPMYERKGYERFYEIDQGQQGTAVFLVKKLKPVRLDELDLIRENIVL